MNGPTGSEDLGILSKFLHTEVSKHIIAPASRYVLLEWCSVALQHVSKHSTAWDLHGIELIQTLARCLDRFLASNPRKNRLHSALVVSRRTIRSIFKSKKIREHAVADVIVALTKKSASSKAENAPVLGVIAGVAWRLADVKPLVEPRVLDFHAFYTRELLGSKAVLPAHIASGMDEFFNSFESSQAFYEDIVPALEKTLLRAPEIVLNNLVTPLVKSLRHDIDLSEALSKNLLKPIISSTKSSNATIRNGALAAYKAMIGRCQSEDAISTVVDELLKNLKDAKASEQRVVLASMLSSTVPTPPSVPKVTGGLTAIVPKETNEAALSSEVSALGRHVSQSLSKDEPIDASTAKLFVDGLRNKKPSIRRIWALSLGSILWPFFQKGVNDATSKFAAPALEALVPTWDEGLANPILAGPSGIATICYILFCFGLQHRLAEDSGPAFRIIDKLDTSKQLQLVDGKSALILNSRVYSKISSPEDIIWVIRALEASAAKLGDLTESARVAWAQAMIYLLVASTLPTSSRQIAYKSLVESSFASQKVILRTVVEGIWIWIQHVYHEERDTAALASQTGTRNLWLVVRAICSQHDARGSGGSDFIQHQLIRLVVLCRAPLISHVAWIDLCLKAGTDPHKLVSDNIDECIQQIQDHTSVSSARHIVVNTRADIFRIVRMRGLRTFMRQPVGLLQNLPSLRKIHSQAPLSNCFNPISTPRTLTQLGLKKQRYTEHQKVFHS